MGPAAHWLSGTSAAVATAGTRMRRGKTAEDARLSGGWAEGGGDKMRTERCKERKGMR